MASMLYKHSKLCKFSIMLPIHGSVIRYVSEGVCHCLVREGTA